MNDIVCVKTRTVSLTITTITMIPRVKMTQGTKRRFGMFICANKSYWDAWFKKYDKTQLRDQIFEWGMDLDTIINLFQSEDIDFKLQKSIGKYTPAIAINSIWEII